MTGTCDVEVSKSNDLYFISFLDVTTCTVELEEPRIVSFSQCWSVALSHGYIRSVPLRGVCGYHGMKPTTVFYLQGSKINHAHLLQLRLVFCGRPTDLGL